MSSASEPLGGVWDAIVVGSGASGGVAAMTLAEGGARVLVIDAGPDFSAKVAFGDPLGNAARRLAGISSGRHRRQSQHPGYWKANPTLYADERRHPYDVPPDRPFLWTRGLQVGGRSLTWGGITLRLSDHDLAGVDVDGERISWPLRTSDLSDHYGHLERWLGVHGARDAVPGLPDGELTAPLPFTAAEQRFADTVRQQCGHTVIHSRGFGPPAIDPENGWPRSSSRGSSLPRAMATGRVRLLADHMVERMLLQPDGSRATGVIAVEQGNGQRHRLEADLIVLAASTIQTVSVLLRSHEQQMSGGFADPSGRLGTRLMDHVSTSQFFSFPGRCQGSQPALSGAGSLFLPFGRELQDADFQGGYGLWGGIGRFDPPRWLMRKPDTTTGFLIGHGEVLPRSDNQIRLSDRTDRWDVQVPYIDCRWGDNETAMVAHMRRTMAHCIEVAGGEALAMSDLFHLPLIEPLLRNSVATSDQTAPPGYYIHEVGGAPMGSDQRVSVVDPRNRLWRVPNVLVVDGACWPTSAWQSPTLTMMALSRRACLLALSSRGG